MIVASVRQFLNVPGRSISIREAVRIVNIGLPPHLDYKFPLSIRKFIKAVPPGRVLRKVIPLNFLQRKFDEFINDRFPRLVKLRLHGTSYGKSNFEVYLLNGKGVYDEKPNYSWDMGHLEIPLPFAPNPDFYFNNLETNRITLKLQPGSVLEAAIHFETAGEEVKINNFPNVNLDRLSLKVKLEFLKGRNKIDLVGWLDQVDDAAEKAEVISDNLLGDYVATTKFRGKTFRARGPSEVYAKRALRDKLAREFIIPDASANVVGIPSDYVDGKIEGTTFEKLLEKLSEIPKEPNDEPIRERLKRNVTAWLIGGEFHVLGVATNGQELTIDYILPLGHLEPFPEDPQLPLDQGRLENIKHIVVLMMENRSFDHMLGYLSKHGGRTDIDGLHGGEKNPYKGRDYFSAPLPGTIFNPGPCHGHKCVTDQINLGKMDGFAADYASRADPGQVMGYYVASQVPVYDALAREFVVCQRWFASHPGPTFPNRHYMLTGRLNRDQDGVWEKDNPEGKSFVPTSAKNIFDHLTAQDIPWRYYEHGYCTLRLYERYTYDNVHIKDAGGDAANFVSDVLDPSVTFPSVTFIDPDFINVSTGNDDQPPADITAGQRLVGRVVDAIVRSPRWNQTLLIITYDEHGGFFDHVPPPQAPAVSSIDRYGVRLPAFVISPWVARGQVTDIVFDHTSILKTIIRCFLHARPPDMGERVSAANDLSMVLQSTRRSDRPSIPVPAWSHRNLRLARKAEAATEGPRDFRELLRTVRSRSLVPR